MSGFNRLVRDFSGAEQNNLRGNLSRANETSGRISLRFRNLIDI